MKRGQESLGLVILGVIAIIAVIGLVLLFTKASSTTGQAIGRSYSSNEDNIGISYPYDSSGPEVQAPYGEGPVYVARSTVNTRTPAYVLLGYGGIEDEGKCWHDISEFTYIRTPDEGFFRCYAVPTETSEGAEGFFDPSSSAYSQQSGGARGRSGGNLYCYAGSTGAEGQISNSEDLIRENLIHSLVRTGKWKSVMINGKEVPVCPSGLNFYFPQ